METSPEGMDKAKVLVVDDDEHVRNSLRDYLVSIGNEVAVASDGFKAVEAAQNMEFDIAFIDFHMPGLNGLEAARIIKRMQPPMRILIMSGNLDQTKRDEIGQAGLDIIEKPFSMEDIKEAVIRLNL